MAPRTLFLPVLLAAAAAGAGAGAAAAATAPAPAPGRRSAGILYEVWHTGAATSMAAVKAKGLEQLTVEAVVRSDGKKTLDDVYGPYGPGLHNLDIWNVEPAELGFYCLYRKRANDTDPPVPDCANTTRVAERHAQLLTAAGFDYVAIDITNWPQVNPATDLAVLRPLEVLFEEWGALRARGVPTPDIAVWPSSPVASYPDGHQTTWSWLLQNVYNDPVRSKLVWRRPSAGGKKTFFVTRNSNFNASVNELISANGGRNDVEVIPVWALFGESTYEQGTWSFFAPCVDPATGTYTTSMVLPAANRSAGSAPCDQYVTTRPDDGNSGRHVIEVTASGGYMLSQCALPFASPGHMRGLTLQRLFKRVLETGAPDLFMSSFNEHIGGRQKAVSAAAIAFNMGLPDDPQRDSVWVDTYASEFSRDIEPSVEGGSRVYEVASSCVRLYKAGRTCTDVAAAGEVEPCCTTSDKLVWNNVWSLHMPGRDRLLTTNVLERDKLLAAPGSAWSEVCNPIGSPTAFCVDTGSSDGRDGPFMVYNSAAAVRSSFLEGADPVALYRCFAAGNSTHFVSVDPACEGQRVESTLGWMSSLRGAETLRALRRCRSGNVWSHALDVPCPAGSTAAPDGVLGFVR